MLVGVRTLITLFLPPLISVCVIGDEIETWLVPTLVLRLFMTRQAIVLLARGLLSLMTVLNMTCELVPSPERLTILVQDSVVLSLPTWFLTKFRRLWVVRHLVPLPRLLRVWVLVTVLTMCGCVIDPRPLSLVCRCVVFGVARGTCPTGLFWCEAFRVRLFAVNCGS